jgi:peptidoglycan hydrolase-like protein with peptidoglycan-binding domain
MSRPAVKSVIVHAALCAALTQAGPASAHHWYGHHGYGAGEALIGGVIGGIIGGAVAGQANRPAQPQAQPQAQERVIIRERVVRQPAQDNYQREQNRNVQEALNFFGFDVGAPDGVLGPRSRNAISQYQAMLNFPVTGQLSEYERSFLLSSRARAQANYTHAAQLAAQHGGQRGILVAYMQTQQAGIAAPQVVMTPQPQVVVAPQPQVVVTPQPQVVINTAPATVETPAAQPQPQTETVVAAAPAMMPSFIGGPVEASMASFCNKTNLLTQTQGGMITAVSMTEPTAALGEQFCLARTYAIDEGERLTAQVQGVTLAQMQEQCAAFAPSMRDYVAGMVAKAPSDATSDLQTFVIQSGMNPAQLSANAKICLSIGYRSDNADVALASALVLVGLGEAAYGEMLAHHMSQGFGAPKRLDRAADWYDATVSAFEGGAVRVVAPGAADRPQVLRTAAVMLRGGTPTAAAPAAQPAVLPSFGMPVTTTGN